MEDLEESNFPGAVQGDASESFNRAALINWLLLFICYWWTYFNVADRGIELLLQFFSCILYCSIRALPMGVPFCGILSIKFVLAEETFWPSDRWFSKICGLPKVQLTVQL